MQGRIGNGRIAGSLGPPIPRAPRTVPGSGAIAPGETADRLIRTGLLTAAAVHEVNNLVCAVLAHAEIGLTASDPEEMRQSLASVAHAAEDMGRWFHGVLEFAKGRGIAEDEVDPVDVVEESVRLLRPVLIRHRIEVAREFEPAGRILASGSHLRQILVNLILNACQAMGDAGGRLTLRVSKCRPEVRIRISDSGPGLSEVVLRHLFEPFSGESRGGAGVGLGLYVTRALVEAMGGTIGVSSEPGGGTSFCLRFPAAA